jgi:hypothetical protein
MKLEEITIDTPLDAVFDSIERGEFTDAEFIELYRGRLTRESETRRVGATKAVDAVKTFEARKRPRTGKWHSEFIKLGDNHEGPGVYLVKCGRSAWHVDPKTFAVRKAH